MRQPPDIGGSDVQDIFWVGLMLVLLAATIGYVALCASA